MNLKVPTMAELVAAGETPDVLFWVGCAGSFDDRAKKITKAIAKILSHCKVKFAVLGTEESCTGDPARRAGNEFTFQMQAQMNIQVLNGYEIKRIVTGCPHCFNTLKNEYPELGGSYEVLHHTQLIQDLINTGKLSLNDGGTFKGKKITFHDPCYVKPMGFAAVQVALKCLKKRRKGIKKLISNAQRMCLNQPLISWLLGALFAIP
jgi:Fe-S oxidoreductase